MRILIVSQYFWPESFIINDLVTELVKCGHDVRVLTGKPNYPNGKIYKGYSFLFYEREMYNGATVYRVPLIPRKKGKGLQLVLNYASFVIFACLFVLFHKEKYDKSLTFAISPITQIFPALLHKKLYKTRTYLWLQDLWPESVTAAGKMKSRSILKVLSLMVRDIYKKTDGILVQSESFIPSIKQKGISQDKIFYVPNWADDIFTKQIEDNDNKYRNAVPEGFIVMFAGNIGEAQDFESIIKAAERTRQIKDIKWVIIGDGRKKEWLEKEIKQKNLSKTFIILGRYPIQEMPYFYSLANIMLLTLKNEEIFSLTIPSKLQSYLACGKPVASMINGIGNNIILEAKCGIIANASDFEQLAVNIIDAYANSKYNLDQMGNNGKIYYLKEFEKSIVIKKILNIFQR